MVKNERTLEMRDKTKNENYFKESLSFTTESIYDFEKILPQVIEKQGADSQGVKNGYNALVMYYTKKVNLQYSLGLPILNIRQDFEKFLRYYATAWEIEYGYIELIRVLSLSVLLNINKTNSYLELLEKKIKDACLNDYLINYLIINIDDNWELNSKEFHFKGIYEPIRNIIDEKNKTISVEMLKKYLTEQWYEIHSECAWYNSHNSKQNTYYGYWAYEAGAISKILKLNDEELKEQQYYPYDLVHFQD